MVEIDSVLTPSLNKMDFLMEKFVSIATSNQEESLERLVHSFIDSMNRILNDKFVMLQQLADNKIRLVQEQIQLEDQQKDLFGIRLPLNSFRKEVEDATNYWLSAAAIQNLIRMYLKERIDDEKEFLIGERTIKDLRLSLDAKKLLLSDFEACDFQKTSENRAWEKVLRSAGNHYAVTFSPESVDESNDVMLITLVHPLERQASMHFNRTQKYVTVLKTQSDMIPQGIYPFIMYQWMYSGEREDLVLKPICNTLSVNKYLLELLQNSKDCNQEIAYTDELWEGIETIQHSMWERELQKHKQDTYDLITYKLGTLATSHELVSLQIRFGKSTLLKFESCVMRSCEMQPWIMNAERVSFKKQWIERI